MRRSRVCAHGGNPLLFANRPPVRACPCTKQTKMMIASKDRRRHCVRPVYVSVSVFVCVCVCAYVSHVTTFTHTMSAMSPVPSCTRHSAAGARARRTPSASEQCARKWDAGMLASARTCHICLSFSRRASRARHDGVMNANRHQPQQTFKTIIFPHEYNSDLSCRKRSAWRRASAAGASPCRRGRDDFPPARAIHPMAGRVFACACVFFLLTL